MTDPELIELFDNWAFGDVMRDATLETPTRLMVQLAALVACQGTSEFRVMVGGALNVGVTPIAIKELTFARLASLGGCEPQLAGHVAGNLAIGNDRKVLISTITHLLPFIGYPRTLNALRIIVLDPYRDSAAVIEASELDYTILRPGWFTHDGEVRYQLTQKGEPFLGHDVSLNSLSDLIVKLATTPRFHIRESLGVSRG